MRAIKYFVVTTVLVMAGGFVFAQDQEQEVDPKYSWDPDGTVSECR